MKIIHVDLKLVDFKSAFPEALLFKQKGAYLLPICNSSLKESLNLIFLVIRLMNFVKIFAMKLIIGFLRTASIKPLLKAEVQI
ncbi:hypothetical protein G7074_14920 [Pedobacter sp. HDW13]|uniref:hypothetical protein n=1 Tax=Pedobacter sp. HDW13 TaxID=2714940 RepID=UPI00140A9E65|nr:hypothetical protein [Pedobacter sp. HDW13]QIL40441.1 hypothetical protein G7074_14920 [Pedobacter sp. HDW13]